MPKCAAASDARYPIAPETTPGVAFSTPSMIFAPILAKAPLLFLRASSFASNSKDRSAALQAGSSD